MDRVADIMARMERADTPLDKAFKDLKGYEVYRASDLVASQTMGRDLKQQFKEERKRLRAAVMRELHLDPEISEVGEVQAVFKNLAQAEIELHKYTGSLETREGERLVREVTQMRDVLETTANMAAADQEPASKRARTANAPRPEAPAAAGASGDFVDLTQEDD
jgi:hypothetical protein